MSQTLMNKIENIANGTNDLSDYPLDKLRVLRKALDNASDVVEQEIEVREEMTTVPKNITATEITNNFRQFANAVVLRTGAKYEPCINMSVQTKGQEKENDMYHSYNIDQTTREVTDETQRTSYLKDRLGCAHSDKRIELKIKFGLEDQQRPRTPQELTDRIKAGLFVLPKDETKDRDYYDSDELVYAIRWRDPAVKEDKDGFKAAEKLLDQAYTAAKDQIMVLTAQDGLKALQDFEAKSF